MSNIDEETDSVREDSMYMENRRKIIKEPPYQHKESVYEEN